MCASSLMSFNHGPNPQSEDSKADILEGREIDNPGGQVNSPLANNGKKESGMGHKLSSQLSIRVARPCRHGAPSYVAARFGLNQRALPITRSRVHTVTWKFPAQHLGIAR